jgi:hypothetical protein
VAERPDAFAHEPASRLVRKLAESEDVTTPIRSALRREAVTAPRNRLR